MRRAMMMTSALLTILAIAGRSGALAGEFNTKLSIADPGPVFKDLIGTDDKAHSLSDFKDAKAVVVCFTCNHCPVAVAYEDRFIDFAKECQSKGVAFVAINVNNNATDALPAMKKRADEKKFNFPYLYDPSQEIGRAYGATVTPHLFVLCPERKVAYMGSFDDSQPVAKVKSHFVKDAVDALLAGKAPEVKETKQFGCGIQYEAAKGKEKPKAEGAAKPKAKGKERAKEKAKKTT